MTSPYSIIQIHISHPRIRNVNGIPYNVHSIGLFGAIHITNESVRFIFSFINIQLTLRMERYIS